MSTLVVLLAVGTMVWLGFWQLQRLDEKEAMLARYARAESSQALVAWPSKAADVEGALYHRAQVDCLRVESIDTIAGHSASGETGWAHIANCDLAAGGTAPIALGWARNPVRPKWEGGRVSGIIGPYRKGAKLVVAPPQAGLAQLAMPDPRDVPNNHLSYAIQWFLFAATALVIYFLALRKRWRASAA